MSTTASGNSAGSAVVSYVNLCKGFLQSWHVLCSSNTTRHFLLLDVTKGGEIPPVSHSKRKACRVHVHKPETCDLWLFLKVSTIGHPAATKFCHSQGLLSVELLIWRTQRVLWVSMCSGSSNSHFLGSASTSSTQCQIRSCSLITAKEAGEFFCRNQQWNSDMIVFASILGILLTLTRAGVSAVAVYSKL